MLQGICHICKSQHAAPMEHSSVADILALARHPDFIDEPGAYTCSPLPSCFGRQHFFAENISNHDTSFKHLLESFENHSPASDAAIFVVLRGIELDIHSCEKVARCIAPTSSSNCAPAFDVCIFDLAPQLCFDKDLRRYVHPDKNKADANIGNDGLAVLLFALKSGPHRGMLLSDLIIPRCNLGKRGAALLAKYLQHDFKNLQHLDIRENPGLGANFSLIAQSMQYCSLLSTLNLSACGLGAHGCHVLQAVIPYVQLEVLALANNYITGEAMARLAEQLTKLTRLRKLLLQQNDLGEKGASALANCFSSMHSLSVLTLDYCVLRAPGLYSIATGLRHLSNMKRLRINHNGLSLLHDNFYTDELVCSQLATAFENLPKLFRVDLMQSGFTSHDALALSRALFHANPTIVVDDPKIRSIIMHLRHGDENSAQAASQAAYESIADDTVQPMRCMLSEVYSQNVVRHSPINAERCGSCESPRVSIIANFAKNNSAGERPMFETRRASFVGDQSHQVSQVVIKTFPYPKSDGSPYSRLLDTELNNIAKVSRFSSLFLEVLAISFHNQSEEGQLLCDRQVIFKESGCSLSVIVPYYPHGNLCESFRLHKGLLEHQGMRHFDDHFTDVFSISPIDWHLKLGIASDLADAMRQCHDQSIVHSDFCCCNVLFKMEQKVWSIKVANAGVLPAASSILSRRAFLAPELLVPLNLSAPNLESQLLSHRSPHLLYDPTAPDWRSSFTKESDVFALGITMLQLFRQSLFDCKDGICISAANQTRFEVSLLPDHASSLSCPRWLVSIQSIVLSCTAYDPKDRPSAIDIRFLSLFLCMFTTELMHHISKRLMQLKSQCIGDDCISGPRESLNWLLFK